MRNETLLRHPELSIGAKGLWLYFQSLRDRQEKISIKRAQEENGSGRTAIMTAISELEEHGFLSKTPCYNSHGMRQGYDWKILERPVPLKFELQTALETLRQAGYEARPIGGVE